LPQDRDITLSRQLSDIENDINVEHKKHEIETILNLFLRGKNKNRNKLIFKLHFYEELTAEEIYEHLPYPMTLKTVQNIIANLKKIVRDGLNGGKRETS
jgi:DNA-directed RNA polymerase specialized sigma subunit